MIDEIEGPRCGHVLFQRECTSCSDWAVKNGVAFARQQSARTPKRDPLAEQQIADARGPVETPLEGSFDDMPRQPVDLVVSLEGEGAVAYETFRLAARALGEHQKTGAALMEQYRAALARLSEVAAK